jgi:hypothetical protein
VRDGHKANLPAANRALKSPNLSYFEALLAHSFGRKLAPRSCAFVQKFAHSWQAIAFGAVANFIWSFYDRGLDFNGTIPVANVRGTYNVPVFSYYRSLNFFGRSANMTAVLPYGVGTFQGDVLVQHTSIYPSVLLRIATERDESVRKLSRILGNVRGLRRWNKAPCWFVQGRTVGEVSGE